MRGDRVFVRLVRRILNRRIVEDVVLLRYDDDAAGVLTCRDLHVLAALGNAFALRAPECLPQLFFENTNVLKRRALRNAADGSRAKCMAATEHLFDVFVRNRLVLAGKVQVDIRRLVAVESQKHLERNVKACFFILRAADGAILIWHVDAAGVCQAVDVEVAVLALRADIVRLERIDLRDAGHGCDKRRTDRTTGAYKVAVRIALVHETLRHEVERGKAVADDGLQLAVKSRLNDLRQRIAVDFVRLANRHVA
ncbi:hypothetical protein SDC9_154868 [bioreactor metagenome]|uniref:Uncharacterized protein n=1 Tax=bioreactor metagenome TaxID=1076179 RepID=A0A645F081_9ZZZZ